MLLRIEEGAAPVAAGATHSALTAAHPLMPVSLVNFALFEPSINLQVLSCT